MLNYKIGGTFRPRAYIARKSLETDKEKKPSKHKSQETAKTKLCQIHQPFLPPSIQACPALRAPRPDPRVTPARGTPPEDRLQERTRKRHLSPSPRKPDKATFLHAPDRARQGAELQPLYIEGKHAEIPGPGGRLPAPRRGWQLSSPIRSIRCSTRPLPLTCLTEQTLDMNKQK